MNRLVYVASLYWHTKDPVHAQYAQEWTADAAWPASLAAGMPYGTVLEVGAGTWLSSQRAAAGADSGAP